MNVFRFIAVVVSSWLLIAGAVAADAPRPNPNFDIVTREGGISYAAPKNGPLRFKALEQEGARFSGKIRLVGTYVYGHTSSDAASELDDTPQLYFLPDDTTRALLPYWYERGPVHEIYFENSDAFLAAVLAPDLIARVKQRKIRQVTGKTAILVDNYFATAECDHPEYIVRFLKLDLPPQFLARNEFAEQLSCG